MEDRVKLMKELQSRSTTHNCPRCTQATYCVMEAGKSANLCWCMEVKGSYNATEYADSCLCKKCLVGDTQK